MQKPLPRYLTLQQVFLKDFNLSLFIGLSLLALYHRLPETLAIYDPSGWYVWLLLPLLNGFLTSAFLLMLNSFFARHNYTSLYYTSDKLKLLFISVLGGASAYYLSTSAIATYFITVAVIIAAFSRIKNFTSKLSSLLYPRRLATLSDLGLFMNFFITLIISFAVINLSVNAIHLNLHAVQAFNFGPGISGIIDALYFSVITMTTVGYGDIIPVSTLGRLVVTFECITCYLTLGIMIGIICRGIRIK